VSKKKTIHKEMLSANAGFAQAVSFLGLQNQGDAIKLIKTRVIWMSQGS